MASLHPASKYRGPQAQGFIVIWRDPTGRQRWQTLPTLEAAKLAHAQALLAERQPRRVPVVDPAITVAAYGAEWLKVHGITLKRRTQELYGDQLHRVIIPAFGRIRVRALSRGQVKRWLAGLLATGLERGTVRVAYQVLHNLLNHALDDEVIQANPCDKLGRQLRLLPAPGEHAARIKAMDQAQLDAFLDVMRAPAARPQDARHYPFFLTLARTGLRLGEAFALQPGDLDLVHHTLRVERGFSGKHLEETPKTRESIRTVDVSPELGRVLRAWLQTRTALCLRHGWRAPWLFLSEAGTALLKQPAERAMTRLCRRAGIGHFTPHALRHTFASLLLQRGENPKYVQQQMGHASLSLTTDLYGKWLRAVPTQGGVAALDGPGVSGERLQAAAEAPSQAPSAPQVRALKGHRPRPRPRAVSRVPEALTPHPPAPHHPDDDPVTAAPDEPEPAS
jgi:integrase